MKRLIAFSAAIYATTLFASFPDLTSGTFEQNTASLKKINPLPDNRSYRVETIQRPRPLRIEELDATQASKGTSWFSMGEFMLRLDEECLLKYRDHDHATLMAFFEGLASASPEMSAQTFEVQARVTASTLRQQNWLCATFLDRDLKQRAVTLGGQCVALVVPKDPAACAHAKEGDTLTLQITLYKMLDAYGTYLPTKQASKPLSVNTFFIDESTYADEKKTSINMPGGVRVFSLAKTRLVLIAGWAMETGPSPRSDAISLAIGRPTKTLPVFIPRADHLNMTAEISLLDAESRFPELIQRRADEKAAAAQAKAQMKEDKRQARADERQRTYEENLPRQRFWTFWTRLVMGLSLLVPVLYVYGRATPLHKTWRISTEGTFTMIKDIIAVAWLGLFFAAALSVYGQPPPNGSLLNAWLTCGIGGVVALIAHPSLRNRFLMPSAQERMEMAVRDGIGDALGGDALFNSILHWVLRFIVYPVFLGGILCPFLWLNSLIQTLVAVCTLLKQRAPISDSTNHLGNEAPEIPEP